MLRGRDAGETLDIVNRLVTAVQQQLQPPQAQPLTAPTMHNANSNEIDDDLLVTNPGEWRRRLQAQQEQRQQQTIAQIAAPIAQQLASTSATLSRRDPANADVAEKWWAEVDALVAPIPAEMRTQQLYDQAAKLVRSNHLDEIANERAQRLAAASTGVEGVTRITNPDGTVTTQDAGGPAWDKIKSTPLGARMIERYGRAKVEKAAAAFGGLDKYADMLSKSRTDFDPSHPSRMYSELL